MTFLLRCRAFRTESLNFIGRTSEMFAKTGEKPGAKAAGFLFWAVAFQRVYRLQVLTFVPRPGQASLEGYVRRWWLGSALAWAGTVCLYPPCAPTIQAAGRKFGASNGCQTWFQRGQQLWRSTMLDKVYHSLWEACVIPSKVVAYHLICHNFSNLAFPALSPALLNHYLEEYGGTCPIWEIVWICRRPGNHFRWKSSNVSCLLKKNQGMFPALKSCTFAPSTFGSGQGKCFHIYWSLCCYRSSILPIETQRGPFFYCPDVLTSCCTGGVNALNLLPCFFSLFWLSHDVPRLWSQSVSCILYSFLPLLSLSGPSLRARSATTEEKKGVNEPTNSTDIERLWKFPTSVRWIHWSLHWSFLHWKKWICLSSWAHHLNCAQPWWLTSYLHVSCFARFIGDDETLQRYIFRLLWVFRLHGEHREDLNLYSDMENQTIFHMFCFSCRRRSARRNREKIVEFILWLRKKELCLTLIGEV